MHNAYLFWGYFQGVPMYLCVVKKNNISITYN